jgi:putative Ca2+/H+ antiporter (TMEM165/GDT1 family)
MSSGARTFILYAVAAAVFITMGVFVPETILSWWEGVAFLLVAVWIVPRLLGLRP